MVAGICSHSAKTSGVWMFLIIFCVWLHGGFTRAETATHCPSM
jgi:hypothetical protein